MPMMSPGPISAKFLGVCGAALIETPIGTEARSFGGRGTTGLPSVSCSLMCAAIPRRAHDWNWYFATSIAMAPSIRIQLEVRNDLDLSREIRILCNQFLLSLVSLGLRREDDCALRIRQMRFQIG